VDILRATILSTLLFLLTLMLTLVGTYIYLQWTLPNVEELKTQSPYPTAFMKYRQAQAAEKGKRLYLRYKWTPLSQIPDLLQRAVIVSEDASFWMHKGVDWHEMKASFTKNIERGKFLRGGSTITQQLAKNLYLSPEKSVYRKLKEILIARRLERALSKRRILELYLNTIELGRGIFGVGKASQLYYQKSVTDLTLDEIIRLVAIIPKPLKLSPNRYSRELRWRSEVILKRLRKFGDIDSTAYQVLDSTFQNLQEYLNPVPTL